MVSRLHCFTDFKNNEILAKDCFLEPSFYSERYGLQWRLDIFYQNAAELFITKLFDHIPYFFVVFFEIMNY